MYTKNEHLDNLIKKLVAAGFTVIVSKTPETYFHYFKDGYMGCTTVTRSFTYTLSCVIVPKKETGTGWLVDTVTSDKLTVERAAQAMKIPSWAKAKARMAVEYYQSVDHFLALHSFMNYKKVPTGLVVNEHGQLVNAVLEVSQ